jgi:multidrug efflux pump subunit AcrB
MPKGFLPQEDQGYFFASVQLPEAASLERTEAVMAQARELLLESGGGGCDSGVRV